MPSIAKPFTPLDSIVLQLGCDKKSCNYSYNLDEAGLKSTQSSAGANASLTSPIDTWLHVSSHHVSNSAVVVNISGSSLLGSVDGLSLQVHDVSERSVYRVTPSRVDALVDVDADDDEGGGVGVVQP